jgi:clan AA aspartic protease (TIGR02281 family)
MSHGGFLVDALLNGVTRVSFVIDSGASEVTIPRQVVKALIDQGTVTKDNFVGQSSYTLADGSEVRLPVIRLRTLTVGGRTVRDVLCSVGNDPSVFLLGQSFLSNFKLWSIDNARGMLLLE